MTAQDLLRALEARGFRFTVDGDRLRVNAPIGSLTPEVTETLAQRKAELLELLRQEPCQGCDRRGSQPDRNEVWSWCEVYRQAWRDLAASYQKSGIPKQAAERRAFVDLAVDVCGDRPADG